MLCRGGEATVFGLTELDEGKCLWLYFHVLFTYQVPFVLELWRRMSCTCGHLKIARKALELMEAACDLDLSMCPPPLFGLVVMLARSCPVAWRALRQASPAVGPEHADASERADHGRAQRPDGGQEPQVAGGSPDVHGDGHRAGRGERAPAHGHRR